MNTLEEIMAIVDGFESEDKSAFAQDILSMLSDDQLEKILNCLLNGTPLPAQ
jgi:hypothetical protein